jgi:hypothetical protein
MSFGQLFVALFMLSADPGNFFQMGMEIARNK